MGSERSRLCPVTDLGPGLPVGPSVSASSLLQAREEHGDPLDVYGTGFPRRVFWYPDLDPWRQPGSRDRVGGRGRWIARTGGYMLATLWADDGWYSAGT